MKTLKTETLKTEIGFIELTGLQTADLLVLGTSAPDNHRIEAVQRTDGRWIVAADVLEDCGPGQTFHHYEQFLNSLQKETKGTKRASVEGPSLPSVPTHHGKTNKNL